MVLSYIYQGGGNALHYIWNIVHVSILLFMLTVASWSATKVLHSKRGFGRTQIPLLGSDPVYLKHLRQAVAENHHNF